MPCQQDILYMAERSVSSKGGAIKAEDLQGFVDAMRETDWWERNFPMVEGIDCATRRSNSNGSVGGMISEYWGRIEIAPCHMNGLYVIHEVCHVLAEARFKSHAHDPWFARIYLEAVYTFLGPEIYSELYKVFEQYGVDNNIDNMNPAGMEAY